VVLFEHLTRKRPYHVSFSQSMDVMRAVCESEPDKPSRMLSQTSQADQDHGGSRKQLQQKLKGDLDNIVLMALRKEPAARYASVEAFSDDIGRHLTGLPVTARKTMRQFRIRKFVRKRSTRFAAAVVIIAIAASLLSFR